jgi:hypothetical protein
MPIDYSRSPLPKVNQVEATYREDMEKLLALADKRGSEQARVRAEGQCEIWVDDVRCQKPDTQTHHMLGGHGVRARGESAKAIRKQRCCWDCHRLVQAETKVRRVGGEMPHYTDRYART